MAWSCGTLLQKVNRRLAGGFPSPSMGGAAGWTESGNAARAQARMADANKDEGAPLLARAGPAPIAAAAHDDETAPRGGERAKLWCAPAPEGAPGEPSAPCVLSGTDDAEGAHDANVTPPEAHCFRHGCEHPRRRRARRRRRPGQGGRMRAGRGGRAAVRPLSMLERQMGRENLNNASSGPSPYVYGTFFPEGDTTAKQGADAGDYRPPPRSEVGRREPGGSASDGRAGEAGARGPGTSERGGRPTDARGSHDGSRVTSTHEDPTRSSSGTGRPRAVWTSSGTPEPRGDPLHDERTRGAGDGRRPPGSEDKRYSCEPPNAVEAELRDPNFARLSLAHAFCNQTHGAYVSRAPNPDGAQGAWPPRGPYVQYSGPWCGPGALYPQGGFGGFDGRGACEGDLGGFGGRDSDEEEGEDERAASILSLIHI